MLTNIIISLFSGENAKKKHFFLKFSFLCVFRSECRGGGGLFLFFVCCCELDQKINIKIIKNKKSGSIAQKMSAERKP